MQIEIHNVLVCGLCVGLLCGFTMCLFVVCVWGSCAVSQCVCLWFVCGAPVRFHNVLVCGLCGGLLCSFTMCLFPLKHVLFSAVGSNPPHTTFNYVLSPSASLAEIVLLGTTICHFNGRANAYLPSATLDSKVGHFIYWEFCLFFFFAGRGGVGVYGDLDIYCIANCH